MATQPRRPFSSNWSENRLKMERSLYHDARSTTDVTRWSNLVKLKELRRKTRDLFQGTTPELVWKLRKAMKRLSAQVQKKTLCITLRKLGWTGPTAVQSFLMLMWYGDYGISLYGCIKSRWPTLPPTFMTRTRLATDRWQQQEQLHLFAPISCHPHSYTYTPVPVKIRSLASKLTACAWIFLWYCNVRMYFWMLYGYR